jgi:hypothetical protein
MQCEGETDESLLPAKANPREPAQGDCVLWCFVCPRGCPVETENIPPVGRCQVDDM